MTKILFQKDCIEILNKNKPLLFNYMRGKMRHDWFDNIEVETALENTLLKIAGTPKMRTGFNSEEELKKYAFKSVSNYARMQFFIKRNSGIEYAELSDNDIMRNFNLAREIINNARKK